MVLGFRASSGHSSGLGCQGSEPMGALGGWPSESRFPGRRGVALGSARPGPARPSTLRPPRNAQWQLNPAAVESAETTR